jgi:hypothetical protein
MEAPAAVASPSVSPAPLVVTVVAPSPDASSSSLATPSPRLDTPPAQSSSPRSETARAPGSASSSPTGSPSMVVKVQSRLPEFVSLTRPRTLPPKAADEETRHRQMHERLMAESRARDEKLKKERDQRTATALQFWTEIVIPNWPREYVRMHFASADALTFAAKTMPARFACHGRVSRPVCAARHGY